MWHVYFRVKLIGFIARSMLYVCVIVGAHIVYSKCIVFNIKYNWYIPIRWYSTGFKPINIKYF